MKTVTWSEILAAPPGTIFGISEAGEKYTTSLYRKGEPGSDLGELGKNNPGPGFFKWELLPQRTHGSPVPTWQPETYWPSGGGELGITFYLFEKEDVDYLIGMLKGEEANPPSHP